eukprot:1928498-Pleurochrysis_carterae.AAC.1
MNSLHAPDRLIRASASLINKCYVLMQSKQARHCVERQKEAMRVQPYSRGVGRTQKEEDAHAAILKRPGADSEERGC